MRLSVLGILIVGCVILSPQLYANDSNSKVDSHQPMLVGGYASAEVTDKTVVRAALAAVTEKSTKTQPIKLIKVLTAQLQVVAGLNYDLNLAVKVGNETRYVQAIVYRDLKDSMQLTHWQWLSKQVGEELSAIPR